MPEHTDLTPQAAAAVERLAYTINEALVAVPVGRTTLYAAIADGRLRTVKIGKRRLVPRDALHDFAKGDAGA